MSWEYIVFGFVLILFSTILYRNRGNPHVHYEGGSPKKVTTWSVIMGIVMITIGILGYFFPKILEWMRAYSGTMDHLSSAFEILGFLALQALLVYGLFYTLIYKRIMRREESDLLPGILFFAVISIAYWAWIFGTNKFDKFKEPFQYLYQLIFK